MFGDYVKSEASEIQPLSTRKPETGADYVLAQTSTAKKRHVFGRSSSSRVVGPVRLDPELSELYMDLARKERRSHGHVYSTSDTSEWAPSNNTIPETLNSSREWKVPCGMDKKYAASQDDVRAMPTIQIAEATPSKREQESISGTRTSFDKENFFTPRKNPEAPPSSTPAQSRCPLSALPVDSAPAQDVSDGVHARPADTRKFGSAVKFNAANDRDIFRTPQFKGNQPTELSVERGRQRLYATSSSSKKYGLPQVPLHPAVLAGQQEAKQLQMQHEARSSSDPVDSGTSRRLLDCTPFKNAPSTTNNGVQQAQTRPTYGFRDSHSSNENLVSSNSWLSHAKPAEASLSSAVPTPVASVKPAQATAVHEKQLSPPKSATESTWLPVSRYPHLKRFNFQPDPKVEKHCAAAPPSSYAPEPRKAENLCAEARSSSNAAEPRKAENLCAEARSSSNAAEPRRVENHCAEARASSDAAEPRKVENHCAEARASSDAAEPRKVQNYSAGAPPSSDAAEPRKVENHCVGAPPSSDQKTVCSSRSEIKVNGYAYEILSLLGQGGSSKVYQVLDPKTYQLKAVKCVNLAETDPSICEGYLNEIKLLADLQDGDSVIRMFDHEHHKESKTLFVVMEKGDTDLSKLIKHLKNSKKISATMIAYYWTEMLNAVSFIHKRGTIHSDLKPANFLLVSGRLKLIDFGIASSVQEDMTSVVKDNLTGTYNYISPEALCTTTSDGQHFKISYKSDVWSLGCILYNLIYGRTPFQHITGHFQKMNAIVSDSHRIQFPDPPISDCPVSLIEAMKRCFDRNPKKRASVDELLQISYLGHVGPERAIISQIASLTAKVGFVQESQDNPCASVIRAIQRLILENEKNLPFLQGGK